LIPGLFILLGSSNTSVVGSICYNSFGVLAPMTTVVGLYGTDILPDIANADRIVVWETNPITNSPPFQFYVITRAKRKGAKITAIDYFMTDICERADDYYLVCSGTDGALALGVLKVIIDEELYDENFVENWVMGFEELEEYINSKTLREWADISDLGEEDIVRLAR